MRGREVRVAKREGRWGQERRAKSKEEREEKSKEQGARGGERGAMSEEREAWNKKLCASPFALGSLWAKRFLRHRSLLGVWTLRASGKSPFVLGSPSEQNFIQQPNPPGALFGTSSKPFRGPLKPSWATLVPLWAVLGVS